jgi:hypothetical protein
MQQNAVVRQKNQGTRMPTAEQVDKFDRIMDRPEANHI